MNNEPKIGQKYGGKVRRGESFSYKILKAIAIGGIVLVAASNPYFGLGIFKALKKELRHKKWRQIYNDLFKLKKKERIKVEQNPDGTYTVKITEFGLRDLKRYELDNLIIENPKRWDGYWRFFSFDIPVNKKIARHSLRGKLKELGFIMVQKSLWAHPFECRKEVLIVANAFEVENYVHFFVAHDVEKESWLRTEFQKINGVRLL